MLQRFLPLVFAERLSDTIANGSLLKCISRRSHGNGGNRYFSTSYDIISLHFCNDFDLVSFRCQTRVSSDARDLYEVRQKRAIPSSDCTLSSSALETNKPDEIVWYQLRHFQFVNRTQINQISSKTFVCFSITRPNVGRAVRQHFGFHKQTCDAIDFDSGRGGRTKNGFSAEHQRDLLVD